MSTALVVDDDPDIRSLITVILRRAGHDVIAAGDGAEALRTADARRPDVILLDVMMPSMSGLEVCRRLRQHQDLASTPIVLLTAATRDTDVQAGLEAGADDYLTKPFSARELARVVSALLPQAD